MLYGSHVEKEKIAAFKQALLSTKPALKSLLRKWNLKISPIAGVGAYWKNGYPIFIPTVSVFIVGANLLGSGRQRTV